MDGLDWIGPVFLGCDQKEKKLWSKTTDNILNKVYTALYNKRENYCMNFSFLYPILNLLSRPYIFLIF